MLPSIKHQWGPDGGIDSVCKNSELSSMQRKQCPSQGTVEGPLLWMHSAPAPSGAETALEWRWFACRVVSTFQHISSVIQPGAAAEAWPCPPLLSLLLGLVKPQLHCQQDTALQNIPLDNGAVASNSSCFELLSHRRDTVRDSAYWQMQKSSI